MITETQRLTLLVWVDHLGLSVREVLAAERQAWYERTTERLIAAHGDALDVLTATTNDQDRRMILKAGALVRCLLEKNHVMED